MSAMKSTAGHLLLISTVILGHYQNDFPFFFNIVAQIARIFAFIIPAIYFYNNPKAYFFKNNQFTFTSFFVSKFIIKCVSWIYVSALPIAWLLLITWMIDSHTKSLLLDILAAYIFYTWLSGSLILAKYLF